MAADWFIWSRRHEFDVFEIFETFETFETFEIGLLDLERSDDGRLQVRVPGPGLARPLRLGRPSCTRRDDRRRREHSDLDVFEPRSLMIRLPGSSGGAIEPVWPPEHAIRKSEVLWSIIVSSVSIYLHTNTRG